ncbi:glycoside hydrolase family 172 protein [Rufibacter roseus]|uniref:Glycoside hydrolase family 172 protein n=1 Tax=Rufibacter roseus TaxID=1567108 RepID=A0ABW2DJL5_9BACT|nr:glycoside hydrolase family 172 protein [Rufibacter roseus]
MLQKLFTAILLIVLSISQLQAQELMGLTQMRDNVKSKRVSSYDRSGGNNDRFENIPDGEKRTVFDVKGAGIINHIWITIAPGPDHLNRNDIIIRMYWDGNQYPSVESPIGPFFGQGWNESYNYASLPLAAGPVDGSGLVSYFAMPFAKGARIEIENQTGRKIDAFYYYVDYVEMPSLPKGTGRFHAWYNRELTEALPNGENEWGTLGPQGENKSGKNNYLIADIKGKGHFVGVNYYVHSPTPMWYGEGDDMIFIDGAAEPTLNGTGTEDYFNTAWCPKDVYAHPYYGYARVNNDIGWLGRTHVYRFHIADPLYFNKSMKFTIEHGHDNALTLDLASVAYWYQSEAARIPAIPGKDERKFMPFIGPVEMHKWRHEWRKNKGGDSKLWGN